MQDICWDNLCYKFCASYRRPRILQLTKRLLHLCAVFYSTITILIGKKECQQYILVDQCNFVAHIEVCVVCFFFNWNLHL